MAAMTRPLKIAAHSTARYATWYFIDELKLLFDAGDGVAAHLGGKCQKVQHIFISHADRDHIGGLLQLYQLAARPSAPPTIYYPKDSGSFPALRDFLQRFDPHLPPCNWVAVEAGMRIGIGRDLLVEVQENAHIAVASGGNAGLVKSLDFSVVEVRRKLKEEFKGLPGAEIGRLRSERGEAHISEQVERRLLGYSGDSPALDHERWRGTELLVHEATFIAPDEGTRGHSELGQVIKAAAELGLRHLALTHFSSRYSAEHIAAAIAREAEGAGAKFPIHALLPGQTVTDLLATSPVWPGSWGAGSATDV